MCVYTSQNKADRYVNGGRFWQIPTEGSTMRSLSALRSLSSGAGFLGASLLPALVCLIAAGAAGEPAPQDHATPPATTFSVATYNIYYRNKDLRELVKTIRQADADLVCLQETNRQSERYIRRHLRDHYRFMAFHTARAAGGLAFLSRAPLGRLKYLPARHGWFGAWICQPTLGGKALQVANVHLQATIPRRGETLRSLIAKLLRTERIRNQEIQYIYRNLSPRMPILIAGDLNSPSSFSVPRFLRQQGLIDSFAAVTRNPDTHATWHWPGNPIVQRLRIDYLFHSKDIRTLACRILQSEASDHFLQVSELTWKPTTRPAPASQPATARSEGPAGGGQGTEKRN